MTTVRVERLPHAEGLALPAYETTGSAGMDPVSYTHLTLPTN